MSRTFSFRSDWKKSDREREIDEREIRQRGREF